MQPVPKKLASIKRDWNPNTFCVSFKLETDENILTKKVQEAMVKYGVDMVVANILATRRTEVFIFNRQSEKTSLRVDVAKTTQVDAISELIVKHITQLDPTEASSSLDFFKLEDLADEFRHQFQRELFVNMQNEQVTTDQIQTLFETFGKVTRVKMSNQNGKAFVQMASHEVAQAAVSSLNETVQLGSKIIVSFTNSGLRPQAQLGHKSADRVYHPRENRDDRHRHRDTDRHRSRDHRQEGRSRLETLFVGNLSFNTDEHSLRDYFKQIGKINDVRIAYTGSGKSKGFGHVEFRYPEDVSKAIKKLNKTILDGREIKLDKSAPYDEDAYRRYEDTRDSKRSSKHF